MKFLAHLQPSQIGLFLIARLRDIWGSYGPTLGSTSRPKASSGQRYPCPASLYWRRSSFGKQGSGPDRGRSPVEWGDFPYVRPSVRTSVRPSPPLGHSARRMDGQTDVCTENIPILQDFVPYRGCCPASQR